MDGYTIVVDKNTINDKDKKVVLAKFQNATLKRDHYGAIKILKCDLENEMLVKAEKAKYTGKKENKILSKLYIGVMKENEKKIHILDASVYNFSPIVLEQQSVNSLDKDMKYWDRNDELTASFGGRRKKKNMDARHRNKLSGAMLDRAVGTAVGDVVDKGVQPSLEVVPVDETTSILPVYNKDTTNLLEAYPISSLISDEDLDSLKNNANQWADIDNKKIDTENMPSYIKELILDLPLNPEVRCKRSCCILYLYYLHIFCNVNMKKMIKTEKIFPKVLNIPHSVQKNILDKFTLKSIDQYNGIEKRSSSAKMKDKALVHSLVMFLILSDFVIDYTNYRNDFHLSQLKFGQHMKAIGCKLGKRTIKDASSDSVETIGVATLVVPLTFPDNMVKKKNRQY